MSELSNIWDIDTDKIVALVTDSGANMVKAIKEIFGANKNITYFPNMINLVAEDATQKILHTDQIY